MKISTYDYDGYVYDFCVEDDPSFECSGFIVHNCALFLQKKRYAMLVHDNEGIRYKEPKMKIMGLETARSSTPKFVRTEMEQTIKSMLTNDEQTTQKMISDFHEQYKTTSPEELAFPRGLNGLNKYSDGNGWFLKGTPKQVKAAIHYNRLVKEMGLDLELLSDGDKLKYISLKEPNPYHIDVIAFPTHAMLPEEFDMVKYIDYDELYQKSFFSPVESLMNACGWNAEKKNDLASLFG